MSNFLVLDAAVLLGFIIFQFIYWRRLKEDYSSRLIFLSGTYILVGVLLGVGLNMLIQNFYVKSAIFDPSGTWFWFSLLGGLAGFFASIKRFNLQFYESFEASAIGGAWWLLLINGINSLPNTLALIATLILFYFFEAKYRKFTWYKSGRVGFSGLASLSLFFLYRIVAELTIKPNFAFVGKIDIILSAVCVFLLLYSLYNLSQEE